MAPPKRLFTHDVGSSRTGCAHTCHNECCLEDMPDTINLFIGETPDICACLETTLTYTTDTNPAGRGGMWNGDITINCSTGSPATCQSQTVRVELWCDVDCDNCECDCTDWAIRLNEGTTHKISGGIPPSRTCCCGGIGGRSKNVLYWDDVLVGTLATFGCETDHFFVVVHWDSDNTCLPVTVNSGCCVFPIAATLGVTFTDDCGNVVSGTMTSTGPNCAGSPCETKWVTNSDLSIQCKDEYGTCQDMDIQVTLRCDKCDPASPNSADNACAVSDWFFDLESACITGVGVVGIDSTCQCPDCDGLPFAISQSFTFSGLETDCVCFDAIQNWAITVTDDCVINRACAGVTSSTLMTVMLYSVGEEEDCECGTAILEYEEVSNNCGCVGRWAGVVTLQCKDALGVCAYDTLPVEVCAHCAECDITDCTGGCELWTITVGTKTQQPNVENTDCCCDGWHYFADVVNVTSGGPCGGQTLNAKVFYGANQTIIATDETDGGCKGFIPKTLDIDITDTCLVVRSLSMTGGLTCTDPTYFASWTSSTFVGFDCWDGSACNNLVSTTEFIIRQRRSDFGWEAVMIGCFDGSPFLDTSPVITCPVCSTPGPQVKFQLTAAFTSTFTGCDGDCNTTRNVTITVTEP